MRAVLLLICCVMLFGEIDSKGISISERFLPPKGYKRVVAKEGSFKNYLQNFKLKPDGTKVYLFNGKEKKEKVYAAVMDIDVGKKDLQQCADAIMRLRAEYLFNIGKKDKISFRLTNGFKMDFKKWANGYRLMVKGNNCSWYRSHKPLSDHKTLKDYLETVFIYAGSHSLEKQTKKRSFKSAKIGDIFIEGGFPGHAVIIVDMAANKKGEKIVLLAQSYMPAQDIHILKNLEDGNIGPWYKLSGNTINTPEWKFKASDLRGFK